MKIAIVIFIIGMIMGGVADQVMQKNYKEDMKYNSEDR